MKEAKSLLNYMAFGAATYVIFMVVLVTVAGVVIVGVHEDEAGKTLQRLSGSRWKMNHQRADPKGQCEKEEGSITTLWYANVYDGGSQSTDLIRVCCRQKSYSFEVVCKPPML
jgi:hypothetical protein